MLSHVYQLAKSIGGDEGNKLDDAGVKVVDVTQQLLKTAEVTTYFNTVQLAKTCLSMVIKIKACLILVVLIIKNFVLKDQFLIQG